MQRPTKVSTKALIVYGVVLALLYLAASAFAFGTGYVLGVQEGRRQERAVYTGDPMIRGLVLEQDVYARKNIVNTCSREDESGCLKPNTKAKVMGFSGDTILVMGEGFRDWYNIAYWSDQPDQP